MNIRSGPSMSNLAQMVIENSDKIDIVRLHNSIKIDVKPTRWRWGPGISGREASRGGTRKF